MCRDWEDVVFLWLSVDNNVCVYMYICAATERSVKKAKSWMTAKEWEALFEVTKESEEFIEELPLKKLRKKGNRT